MSLARYRWSSIVIQSRTPLPELGRCDSAPASLRFECRATGQPRRTGPWSHRWVLPGRARWLSIARSDEGHVLRFERLADFMVSADGRAIRCEAARTTSPETIRHLLLDQVLPAIASGEGRFGVHASAVAIEGAAVAFLGRAGRGKSTLAAVFGLRGAPVVTDDCLILDLSRTGVVAVPTYPSLRLARETIDRLGARVRRPAEVAQYSSKLRLGTDNVAGVRFRRRPLPLGRLYLLERGRGSASPRIEPLTRRQSYIELMKFRFRLDPRDPIALGRECDQLVRIAHAVPLARLQMPSDFAALPDVLGAILADIRASRR
jgi:hypothetical protein